MCATELAAGDALRVIPGESVSRAQLDLSLPQSSSLAPDTLAALGRNLGADLVVVGSYTVVPGARESRIRVDARLQDCSTGETLASVPVSGSEMDLFKIASDTGAALRSRLGLGAPPEAEGPAKAVLPSAPEAAKLYAEGLVKLRRMEATEAARIFERAAEEEPRNPLIYAALSSALTMTGHALKAQEEARKAFDLSESLPRKERLEVEAQLRCTERNWDRAAEVYQALWGFYPDDLDYGLGLASAQAKGGKGREALDTVARLSSLPAPLSEDPRIDLSEGEAAGALGDWKHQEEAASRAAQKAEALGARQVLARALSLKANCLRRLGRNDEAVRAAEQARALYLAVGDTQGAAGASTAIGYVRLMQGDLEEAGRIGAENLKVYESLGDIRGRTAALNTLANVAYARGQLKRASGYYKEALASLREIDDPLAMTKVLSNLANALQLSGDLEGARIRQEEVLALARQTGDSSIPPYAHCGLGSIELTEGYPARAMERYQQALDGFEETGEKSGKAYALFSQGEVLFAQDRLREAEAKHREALRIRTELAQALDVAESQMSLAELALERSDAGEARDLAQASLKAIREQGPSDTEALALSIMVGVLLAEGRPEEALKTAQGSARELRKVAPENVGYRLLIETVEAEALSRCGSSRVALTRLEEIAGEARRRGYVHLGLEAELALGRLEIRQAERASGVARLRSLAEKAAERGFFLIARKAGEELRKGQETG
jgi:tetratricopeptide (TPR) repeat protein